MSTAFHRFGSTEKRNVLMIGTGRWPCSLIFYLSPAISIMIVFNFAHMRFDLISVEFHPTARRYGRTLLPFNVHIFPLQFDRKSNGNLLNVILLQSLSINTKPKNSIWCCDGLALSRVCLNLKRTRGRSSVGKQSRWESYMELVLSYTLFAIQRWCIPNGTLRSPFENLICSFELNVNMHASPNRKLNVHHKMGSVDAVKVHNYADRILSQWFRVQSRSARCIGLTGEHRIQCV